MRRITAGSWPAAEFRYAQVTTGSTLALSWFNRVRWDPLAYRLNEPGDWHRYRRLRYLGARLARHPEPLLRHYRERSQDAAQPPSR